MASMKGGKSAAAPRKSNADERIDECARLLQWENENKDKINKLKKLKEELVAVARENASADQEYTLIGDEFEVVVEAEKDKRELTDARKAQELLGDDVFYAAVNVPMKVLDDYLTPPQREMVTSSSRTGGRTISIKRVTRRAKP